MMLAAGCSRQAHIRVKTMAASTEEQQIARREEQTMYGCQAGVIYPCLRYARELFLGFGPDRM
jgi:hypothetical protein